MHVRTVAAIMMWFVVVLLILNRFLLKSGWVWLICVALMIMAVIVYFIPRLRKSHVQMDTISGLNNCKILGIIDHLSSIEVSSTNHKNSEES